MSNSISDEIRRLQAEILRSKEENSSLSQVSDEQEDVQAVSDEQEKPKNIQVKNVDNETTTLHIHHRKCLQCIHLVGQLGKKLYSSCHFSAGNENCPAAEIKISVRLPYERIAEKLFKAHMENDAATLSALMARLNRQDPYEIKRVLSLYAEKVALSV